MKTKIVFGFICLLNLNLLATDYYVKPTGTDGALGTSWNTAWKTIKYAANTISNNNNIYISNGSYYEQVNIIKKTNVQFIAYGSGVFLDGGSDSLTNYGFRIKDCQSIGIKSFLVERNKSAMIFITNSQYCIISNNQVFRNKDTQGVVNGCGIKLMFSDNNKISTNTVYSIEADPGTGNSHCYGISLIASHSNSIIKNEVKWSGSGKLPNGLGVNIWCHGIYLQNSDNNLIRYNDLHDMDHYGIHIVASDWFPGPNVNLNNKILDNSIHGMDTAIITENYPGTIVADSLKGQIIGRNKIYNIGKGIIWYSTSSSSAGSGGYIYKNMIAALTVSDYPDITYPEGVNLYCDPGNDSSKVNFQYNSIQGFYKGIVFDKNNYSFSNNAIGESYYLNIVQRNASGSLTINYCATQTTKVGSGVTAGTGNVNGEPLYTALFDTRLEWNSPCIGTAAPGPNGVRACIGNHTSWLHAQNETANNTTIYTMVFVTSPYDGAIPANGIIQIEFPSTFSISSPNCIDKNFDGGLSASSSGSTITFTRTSGTTIPPGKAIKILFGDVNNPDYNLNTHYCKITTMSNNGVIIEQEDSNDFRTIDAVHVLTVTTNITISETNAGTQDMRIMSIHIFDTHIDSLESIKIGNAGTMVQGSDITNVKVYIANSPSTGYYYNPGSFTYIADLIWNGTYWSNGNLSIKSNLLSYPGADLLITVDYANTVDDTRYIQPYIPVDGIQCSGGLQVPSTPLTNQGEIWHISLFTLDDEPIGIQASFSAFGDLNNDGWLDYVISGCVAPPSDKRIVAFINDQAGNLVYSSDIGGLDRAPLVLSDVDNDNDLDLIYSGEGIGSDFLRLKLNDGSGNFGSSTVIGPYMSDGSLATADVNNDGDLDLIIAGGAVDPHLEVYCNNGNGSFSNVYSVGIQPFISIVGLAMGDLNNDGFADIIICGDNRLEIFLNRADNSGTFGSIISLNPGDEYSSVSVGDLDNDGWLDFIVTGGNNDLAVYINNHNNTFTRKLISSPGYSQGCTALGDVDNDGDLDLFAVGGTSVNAGANIYINNGDGVFSSPFNIQIENTGSWVYQKTCAFGDLDNDGDLDLIINDDVLGHPLRIWKNISRVKNNPPNNPVNLNQNIVDYKWRFTWQVNPIPDDHTSDIMLRYKVSIGTNQSGVYDYRSEIMDYPCGQANIGNVAYAPSLSFQSKLPSYKTVYWKVQAIDTSFKLSTNALEVSYDPIGKGPFFVATNGSDANPGTNGFPFRTIQRAVDVMSAGPTNIWYPWCYIGPGTYHETVLISSNKNPYYMFFTALSNKNPPILDGTSTSNIGFFITNVNNIRIANIIIKNFTDSGIKLAGPVTNVRIFRNLIYQNPVNISLHGNSVNCELINNTIFGSLSGSGVVWSNSSSGIMLNNILLSNNLYGVKKSSIGIVSLNYNDFYGNQSGITSGGFIWGRRNLTGDPMLDTVTSFTITSPFSFAMDSASNIINISDIYEGSGPDMGWRESNMTNFNNGPFYVDITNGWDQYPGTIDRPFKSIQRAVQRMSPGVNITSATCFVKPGDYYEYVWIAQNNNPGYMVFKAYDTNSPPQLHGNGTNKNYNYGIEIQNADRVIIDHFRIQNYRFNGIYLHGGVQSNIIINNEIFSNLWGINISGNGSAYNKVWWNRVHDNTSGGIYIADNYATIAHNLSFNNGKGIYFSGIDNQAVNNTVVKNSDNGLESGSSPSYIYNNISLSNGLFGIVFGDMFAEYNVCYGNGSGPLSGNFVYSINFFGDPMLDTVSSFTITSRYSAAVDNATNIPGISDTWNGQGPDIGWKESGFTATNYVHILPPVNKWTNTIRNALTVAQNDLQIECYIAPWPYSEHIYLNGRTNISIRAKDWDVNHNKTSTVINGLLIPQLVEMTNCKKITLEGFRLTNTHAWDSGSGITMEHCVSNRILNNDILNSYRRGIWLMGTNNTGNLIYGANINKQGNYGILMEGGTLNVIRSNRISGTANIEAGIQIQGNARDNIISKNEICSNSWYGLYIHDSTASYNIIASNVFYRNSIYGIYISQSGHNIILTNIIRNENRGICISDGDRNIIRGNILHNNNLMGIRFDGVSRTNHIVQNTFYSNPGYDATHTYSFSALSLWGNDVDNNSILSNTFYTNGCTIVMGSDINDGPDNNWIYRNLIRNSPNHAIYSADGSYSNKIYQNTFYNNNNGVYLANPSTAQFTNNIFLSHSGYALYSAGGTANSCRYDYNNFYDNTYITNSTSVWFAGQSNYYTPPIIDTVLTFEITSPSSICVDHAKRNIPDVSDAWLGNGPDIGWKEYNGTYNPYPHVVHIWPANVWTNSITNALKTPYATNNTIIECHTEAGPFFESVRISGRTNVILRGFEWTNSGQNTNTFIDPYWRSRAITITNCKKVTVQGFTIRNATNGIYITKAYSNRIVNNIIIDHYNAGVLISTNSTKYITIASNKIYKNSTGNQQYGIRIFKSSFNSIYSNRIYDNNVAGILMTGQSRSNLIYQNNIFNQNDWNQNYGISIDNGNKNIIRNNNIFHHQENGILLSGLASTNCISQNIIWSNNLSYGIYLLGNGTRYNIIMSNEIYGITSTGGIYIGDGASTSLYNIIKRNLLHHNGYGITYLNANNNNIINNTLYKNSWGISTTYGEFNVYNNIFLSNQIAGIFNASGTVYLACNTSYGQSIWDPNWSPCTLLFGNYTNLDPLIDTVTSFTITSRQSPCVDSATNVFSEPFMGYGLDMGWKESSFTATNYVHILPPMNIWTNTIQNALNKATNNCVIDCYIKPTTYFESVRIQGKTNLTIQAHDWEINRNNDTTFIDGTARSNAIFITNSTKVAIKGFSIKNAISGIELVNAFSNTIINNRIYDNQLRGLFLETSAKNNKIVSNQIYNDNGSAQDYGLELTEGAYNLINNNQLYNNDIYGIYFHGTGVSNRIENNQCFNSNSTLQDCGIVIADNNYTTINLNQIYNQNDMGIYFYASAQYNDIKNNLIYSNQNHGIYSLSASTANFNTIESNMIFGTKTHSGISMQSVLGNIIKRNLIYGNKEQGIDLASVSTHEIINNTIFKNGVNGILFGSSGFNAYNNIIISNSGFGMNDTGGSVIDVKYNNFYGNTSGAWNSLLSSFQNSTNIDPLIDTVTSFTITSALSPAVDSATNLYNESYNGYDLDRGWKESSFSNNYVHILPHDIWADTITHALSKITNNALLLCYEKPYDYQESVDLSARTNITIIAEAWSNRHDNTNTIINSINQNSAFILTDCKKITIKGFTIQNSSADQIDISASFSNRIWNNRIINSGTRSIYIHDDISDNNSIISNFIRSSVQNYGIHISDGDYNQISANRIAQSLQDGIYLDGTAVSNSICRNSIVSNANTGININSVSADYNTIASNQIYKNIACGIWLQWGSYNNIYRNRIYKNGSQGIYLLNTIDYSRIINNTLYSNGYSGVYGDSVAYLYNNIFLSNRRYGIERTGGTYYAGYNAFYGNELGPYSGVTLLPGNITGIDPLISTVSSLTITSPLSCAVDTATNYYSELFNGNGLDMGWKESSFTQTQVTNYVRIWPSGFWTNSITNALKSIYATNNTIIECLAKPAGFLESVRINKKTNLILRSWAWTNSQNNSTTILSSLGFLNGIIITNSRNITIAGMTIKNATGAGIYINNSLSNNIVHNRIIDNHYGISILSDLRGNNRIYSNEIFQEMPGSQVRGISIVNNDNNTIQSNRIYNNVCGVYNSGNSISNRIENNRIFFNTGTAGAIRFTNCRNNFVLSNTIYGNTNGIYISNGTNHYIRDNIISLQGRSGILFDGTSTLSNLVVNNTLFSNLFFDNNNSALCFSGTRSYFNTIRSNKFYGNERAITFNNARKNNIIRNLFHDNCISDQSIAVYLYNSSFSNKVYQNTFYNNNCGIDINASSAAITNNIFWSHVDIGTPAYSGYALYSTGAASGSVRYDYNDFFANTRITNAGGSVWVCGPSNRYSSPMLDPAVDFTIYSPASICVDHAKIIPGVSDVYINAPDIGWKESPYTWSPIQNRVHIIPANVWTNSITNAMKSSYASNNTIVECYYQSGPFYESVRIRGKTNLILRSYDWTNRKNNTTTIIDASSKNKAVFITNSKNITVLGFTIRNATAGVDPTGIYINKAYSNQILHNRINNNQFCGIYLRSASTFGNMISSNSIFNSVIADQDYGIYINDSSDNTMNSNQIFDHLDSGIYMKDSDQVAPYTRNNTIINNCIYTQSFSQNYGLYLYVTYKNSIRSNRIYNNTSDGIYLYYGCSSNSICNNYIYNNNQGINLFSDGFYQYFNNIENNHIYNLNGSWKQQVGIKLYQFAYHNNIHGNTISRQNDTGIYIYLSFTNVISRNQICSNANSDGIYLWLTDYHIISTNIIYDNAGNGINNMSGSYDGSCFISRNVLSHNNYGFYNESSINNTVVNNTIINNLYDGIYADSSSSYNAYNNIILSNNRYGVNTGTLTTEIGYNIFYGNTLGFKNGIGIVWNQGNWTNEDPMIQSSYPFAITSGASMAVDHATNIPGVSDVYFGIKPDIGWLESNFTNSAFLGPFYVDDDTGNDLVNDGTFTRPFRTIQKAANMMSAGIRYPQTYIFPGLYMEHVRISSNMSTNMTITKLSNTAPVVYGALITNNAFKITNTGRIKITKLTIKNFSQNGILIQGLATNITLWSNSIYSNNLNGIFVDSANASKNYFVNNQIWGTNQDHGIRINDGRNNFIQSNTIFSLQTNGIYLYGNASDNTVGNNTIFLNNASGIRIYGADNNHIIQNILSRQKYGLTFVQSATNNYICMNDICSNLYDGILFSSGSVKKNTVISNRIWMNGYNGISLNSQNSNKIYRNLLRNNKLNGILLYASTDIEVIHNTIFENTIHGINVSQNNSSALILNNIFLSNYSKGISASAAIPFVAYNLFYKNSDAWENIIEGPGNITNQDPLLDTVSSFTIISVLSPAVDMGSNIIGFPGGFLGNDPDMGWKESPFTAMALIALSKSISNVTLNSANYPAIPGTTITYKIIYSNAGSAGRSVIIYDKISPYTTYDTNLIGTATGWTLQYSTNLIPDQGYASPDYLNDYTDRSRIKWIRWKKNKLGTSEDGMYLLYTVIIK